MSSDVRSTPAIYSRQAESSQARWTDRLVGLVIGLGCLGGLCLAAWLNPDRSGIGTHGQLGFAGCQFLDRTGLPCPTCGMTTSFAWFVRGNLAASLWVQPMGAVLAVLACVAAWTGLYVAIIGRPAHRLLRLLPTGYYLFPLMFLVVAAWGWKMLLIIKGIDGWQ